MGKVVEIDCEKSMKLEISPKVTKSKRSLHWCRSISKEFICAGFITVSVKKLLHYRTGGVLQYRAYLLHYRALITLSGVFYYIIRHVLQYRAFITLSVGTIAMIIFLQASRSLAEPHSSVDVHFVTALMSSSQRARSLLMFLMGW